VHKVVTVYERPQPRSATSVHTPRLWLHKIEIETDYYETETEVETKNKWWSRDLSIHSLVFVHLALVYTIFSRPY